MSDPIDSEVAVRILNERQHWSHAGWHVLRGFVYGTDTHKCFTVFEAVAIAEKYARDEAAKAERPAGSR